MQMTYQLIQVADDHIKTLYEWLLTEKDWELYTCRPLPQLLPFDEYRTLRLKKGYVLMKKLLIYCIVLLIVLTGCTQQSDVSSKDDLKLNNTPLVVQSTNNTTPQQEQNQQVYKPSVPYNQGEDLNIVANNLITMYLEHYKTASDAPDNLKLKDYKIKKAEVYQTDKEGFMFNAIFSVLPEMDGAYVAGNGIIGDNGWVNDKCLFVKVSKDNNTYKWVDWGTSP